MLEANIESLREFALRLPACTESFPFGDETLVFKVEGKVFLISGLDDPEQGVNLKCEPQRALDLRDTYPDCIVPGYHMNKKHWNTLKLSEAQLLPSGLLEELVLHSYKLVLQGLRKASREHLLQSLKELKL